MKSGNSIPSGPKWDVCIRQCCKRLKKISTLLSESFESDTSDVRRRGFNETLESAAMRNIQTLAGGTTANWPIQFSVDISLVIPDLRVSHHDINFGCQQVKMNKSWGLCPIQKGLYFQRELVPWVCQEIFARNPSPPTTIQHLSLTEVPATEWQSDRVTEVKRCDTVIVPSPTITRESCWGATYKIVAIPLEMFLNSTADNKCDKCNVSKIVCDFTHHWVWQWMVCEKNTA